MSRVHTLTSKTTRTQQAEPQTKTKTKKPKTKTKHKPGRVVGRGNPNSEHWRCPECTFINDPSLTVCNTCKAERKVDEIYIAKKKPKKPSQPDPNTNPKPEEAKQLQSHEVYHERADHSDIFPDPSRLSHNVPIPTHDQQRALQSANLTIVSDLPVSYSLPRALVLSPEESKQSSVQSDQNETQDMI